MNPHDVHGRTQDAFSQFLEGELPAEEKDAVEAHLATCLQCRTQLERFRRTLGGLSALKHKAPATFLPAIQEQIHSRSRGRFFGKRWKLFGRVPFEWVSLAMIVAMLVYYIATLRSAPSTITPAP